jgi:hypothetical protein
MQQGFHAVSVAVDVRGVPIAQLFFRHRRQFFTSVASNYQAIAVIALPSFRSASRLDYEHNGSLPFHPTEASSPMKHGDPTFWIYAAYPTLAALVALKVACDFLESHFIASFGMSGLGCFGVPNAGPLKTCLEYSRTNPGPPSTAIISRCRRSQFSLPRW